MTSRYSADKAAQSPRPRRHLSRARVRAVLMLSSAIAAWSPSVAVAQAVASPAPSPALDPATPNEQGGTGKTGVAAARPSQQPVSAISLPSDHPGELTLGAETPARPAPQTAPSELADIVVTAEKRPESLQRAPAAITSVSGERLAAAGASDLSNMSNFFPSARFEYSFGFPHLYVRGIGSEQDRITVDPLVNVFVDGVLLPREMGSINQSDVSAIELLPGPQGTLYGASSVGGVLNIRNNRPTQGKGFDVLGEYGNYNAVHIRGIGDLSVSDRVAVRGSIDYVGHDPYETTGRWGGKSLTARAAVSYNPSDRLSIYAWGLAYIDHSISQEFGLLDGKGNWIAGSDAWDIGSHHDCDTVACNGFANRPVIPTPRAISHDYIFAGQLDWHVAGVNVTDIPSYLIENMNYDLSGWVFAGLAYQAKARQLTNELRVYSDSSARLQWLTGLYVMHSIASSFIPSSQYEVPRLSLLNIAPYAQLTYSITDSLKGTIGGRFTSTRKDAAFLAPAVLPSTSASWRSLDWKAGLEFQLDSRKLLYVTAQSGSSPGTLDPSNVVNGRPNVTKLTKLYSLTAGWKSQFWNGRLRVNNEAFYYRYNDFLIQTSVCGNAQTCLPTRTVFLNAPSLVSFGDQLDVHWLVTSADSLDLALAATSTKTTHWITDTGKDLSHQELVEAPRLTITVGGEHIFRLSNGGAIHLRADSFYSDGYWADFQTEPGVPVHAPALRQRAYTTTNVGLTYHSPSDNWKVGLWARNLENKAQLGPVNPFNLGLVQGLGQISGIPRTFGLQFALKMGSGER